MMENKTLLSRVMRVRYELYVLINHNNIIVLNVNTYNGIEKKILLGPKNRIVQR